MKNLSRKLLGMLLTAWFCSSVGQAATLTVSPAVTSNTYSGVITLTITGLTNHEPVVLQKFLDANTNGLIDAGEVMLDQFSLSESGVTTIGGITNLNVPFDSDNSTSTITTALNFAPPLTLENITGQHIFKLTSPAARFTPVTATLLVTNANTGQTLSGIAYSNGVVPLPGVIVVVLPQNGGYTAAAVTDSNGRYRLNVAPGSYVMTAALPNYFTDQNAGPQFTLTNGMSLTNNLSLTNGTTTISGNVFNAANSNVVAGFVLQLQSGGLFALAFTDTSGNYSAAVTPNFWKVKPIKERTARRAFVVSQANFQVNTTSGNVTNANLALYPGDALFYGRISDNASAPLANIEFTGSDTNNFFNCRGYSDAGGNYTVAVMGNTNYIGTNSFWEVNPNSSDNIGLANYIINNFPWINIVPGQAVRKDFVALPITGHISGRVQDNFGTSVVNVSLYADTIYAGSYYQSINGQTDSSGNYTLGVANGAWGVRFSYGDSHDLPHQGLVDLFQPYNTNVPPTNAVVNITVYTNGTPLISQPARQSATQFGFNVVGSVGVSYSAQVSTNLAKTNWTTFSTFTLTSNYFPIVDTHATNGARFYRLLKN